MDAAVWERGDVFVIMSVVCCGWFGSAVSLWWAPPGAGAPAWRMHAPVFALDAVKSAWFVHTM